jgi:hypothetical protein
MSPPRSYQVEELMRGIQLPIPPLQHRPLKAIVELLTEAWNTLLETHENILRTDEEKVINALMDARMNCLYEQKPEWKMLVTGITRGRESINFDASKLENRPDLSIHLTCRSSRLPLVVECKLMDSGQGKGIDLYCQQGLSRFVDGQYAWYAQEAFMLAYVRDGATITTCLTPHLEKYQPYSPDPFLTDQLPEYIKSLPHELAQSRHHRRFPDNPGTIAIWHLWLS